MCIIMDDKKPYLYGERGTSDSFFSIIAVKTLRLLAAEKGSFREGWTERGLGNLLAVGPTYHPRFFTSIESAKNYRKKGGERKMGLKISFSHKKAKSHDLWFVAFYCTQRRWRWYGDRVKKTQTYQTSQLSHSNQIKSRSAYKKLSSFASPSSLTRCYPNSYCMIEWDTQTQL